MEGFQDRPSHTMALKRVGSFLMQAVWATLGGLPMGMPRTHEILTDEGEPQPHRATHNQTRSAWDPLAETVVPEAEQDPPGVRAQPSRARRYGQPADLQVGDGHHPHPRRRGLARSLRGHRSVGRQGSRLVDVDPSGTAATMLPPTCSTTSSASTTPGSSADSSPSIRGSVSYLQHPRPTQQLQAGL